MTIPALRNYIGLLFMVFVLLPSGCATTCPNVQSILSESGIEPTIESRPSTWAAQMKGHSCNVPNFYKIDKKVYRSARPTEAGLKLLCEKTDIQTIINLEMYYKDPDITCKKQGKDKTLIKESEPVSGWPPESPDTIRDKVIKVMSILLDSKRKGDFLIHCWQGKDRTGLMSAMYSILRCNERTNGGATDTCKKEAIDEMVNGGYGFNTEKYYYFINYIKSENINKLQEDIDKEVSSASR